MMKICLYGVSLWAPITTVFGQDLVTNVTAQLWSTQLQNLISIEAEYPPFLWPVPMENLVEDELADKPEAMFDNFIVQGCAFHRVNHAQNTLWACDVKPLYEGYHQEYPKIFPDPFAFIMAFDEEGHPNQNWLVNRSPQPHIAWKDAAYHWDQLLAIGAGNTILTYRLSLKQQHDQLVALAISDNSDSDWVVGQPVWQYVLPDPLENEYSMMVLRAENLDAGGYILMMGDGSPNYYQMMNLGADGQMSWRKEYQISELSDSFYYWDRNFFMTRNQHIVIYNSNILENDPKKDGSEIRCLDEGGQEINHHFFSDIYWGKAFSSRDNGGFGLVYYDKKTYESGGGSDSLVSASYQQLADRSEKKSDFVNVMFLNSDCQPSTSSQLIIPTHDLGEKLWWDQIQAVAQAPDGHLLVVYLQQEESSDDKLPFPNLYLAEFESNGKLVRDTAIIAGENQDRAYLENKGDDVVDALNTQIAFLPKTKELLISVENLTLQQEYQIMLEEKEAVQRGNRYYYPRMYKVKLD